MYIDQVSLLQNMLLRFLMVLYRTKSKEWLKKAKFKCQYMLIFMRLRWSKLIINSRSIVRYHSKNLKWYCKITLSSDSFVKKLCKIVFKLRHAAQESVATDVWHIVLAFMHVWQYEYIRRDLEIIIYCTIGHSLEKN